MNMSLVSSELNYCDIDAGNNLCQGYYIIDFFTYPYTLKEHFNVDRQVISSGEMAY